MEVKEAGTHGINELLVAKDKGHNFAEDECSSGLTERSFRWTKDEPNIKDEPLDERDMEVSQAHDFSAVCIKEEEEKESCAMKSKRNSTRNNSGSRRPFNAKRDLLISCVSVNTSHHSTVSALPTTRDPLHTESQDERDVYDEREHGGTALGSMLCQVLQQTNVNQPNTFAHTDAQASSSALSAQLKNPKGAKWTETQTRQLFQLVKKKWHITEGELGPGLTREDQQAAWASIASAFNAKFQPVIRSAEQCEMHWYKTKARIIQDDSFLASCSAKGGDPGDQTSVTPAEIIVLDDPGHDSSATGGIDVSDVIEDHFALQNERRGGCTTANITPAEKDQSSVYVVDDGGTSPSPPMPPPKPDIPIVPVDFVKTWSSDDKSNPKIEKLIDAALFSMKRAWDAERDLYMAQHKYFVMKLKELKRANRN